MSEWVIVCVLIAASDEQQSTKIDFRSTEKRKIKTATTNKGRLIHCVNEWWIVQKNKHILHLQFAMCEIDNNHCLEQTKNQLSTFSEEV